MTPGDLLTFAALAFAILAITPFLGRYIHRVMEGERTVLSPVLRPVERVVYRLTGVDETAEQDWKSYAICVLVMALVPVAICKPEGAVVSFWRYEARMLLVDFGLERCQRLTTGLSSHRADRVG